MGVILQMRTLELKKLNSLDGGWLNSRMGSYSSETLAFSIKRYISDREGHGSLQP